MDRIELFLGGVPRRALCACGLLGLVLAGGAILPAGAAPQTTGAVGQIAPAGGIVGVVGAQGSLLTEIFVHSGQEVKAGTLLMRTEAATADSDPALARKQLQAAQDLAVQQVQAQAATVALAQSRNDQAHVAFTTYQNLGSSIVSKKEMDGLASAANDAANTLAAEQARLKAVKTQTQSNLNAARRQLEAAVQGTELRAPIDGTVLKIARHVGDRLGSDPAIQLGDLRSMYVVCQIYEGDLLHLKPGMRATITAQPLSQPLYGRIEEIGRMVDTQARLGEVRIRLDSTDPASRLVGMQVDVAIER